MEKFQKGALEEIERNRAVFSLAFVGLFVLTFAFLYVVGATPDPGAKWQEEHGGMPIASDTAVEEGGNDASARTSTAEEPMRIVADSINLDAKVNNPSSTDLDVLDESLLTGAVRYPTSGELGVNGTVLLFGHSSYLPVVHNQAYKTFDGIQDLRTGDEVSVYSSTKEYRYKVTGVRKASAATDDSIALPSDAQHLTLVTCNSFGEKTDRYVVTADFVGTYSLANTI